MDRHHYYNNLAQMQQQTFKMLKFNDLGLQTYKLCLLTNFKGKAFSRICSSNLRFHHQSAARLLGLPLLVILII